MVKTQRDPRRMRSRPKASDHLRMPAALARGCQTRLDPLPNRPIALHQDHRSVDPVLARPEPEIPPHQPLDPSPRVQDLLHYLVDRALQIFYLTTS